jgi:hypothetical protein
LDKGGEKEEELRVGKWEKEEGVKGGDMGKKGKVKVATP